MPFFLILVLLAKLWLRNVDQFAVMGNLYVRGRCVSNIKRDNGCFKKKDALLFLHQLFEGSITINLYPVKTAVRFVTLVLKNNLTSTGPLVDSQWPCTVGGRVMNSGHVL